MALSTIRNFSGGEKARLALAIVVWQKPNLLLLDEPTNHLDLEMCHALTVALQGFEGAVIIVSHDRHLLRNTVDQFLLVAQGRAEIFDGDLDDYSHWLLEQRKLSKDSPTGSAPAAGNKKEQRQQNAELRKKLSPISNAIKKIEQQIAKTEQSLETVESELGNSDLYDETNKNKLQTLLQDQGKLKRLKEEQEERWFELSDDLELLQAEIH